MSSRRSYSASLWICSASALLLALATCQRPAAGGGHGAEAAPPAGEPAAAASAPARGGPAAAKRPLGQDGALQLDPSDRCPVCAMQVQAHSKFASGLQLKDGTTYYFCGTGCLLRTWLHPEVYISAQRGDIARLVVRDYFSGRAIDARQAYWVAGSDVVGPMGPALVPLADQKELEDFIRRHGHKGTFRLDALDDARWLELTGRAAAPAH